MENLEDRLTEFVGVSGKKTGEELAGADNWLFKRLLDLNLAIEFPIKAATSNASGFDVDTFEISGLGISALSSSVVSSVLFSTSIALSSDSYK